MGKALFFRDGRGVRLTSYGEVLLESAFKILKLNDGIQMTFSEKIEKSTISIGVYIEFTLYSSQHASPDLGLFIQS